MLIKFYSKNPKTDIFYKCCDNCRAKPVKKCIHNRLKSLCVDCKGGSICIHGKIKSACRYCDGSSFCIHNINKKYCRTCCKTSFCIHNKIKVSCKKCGGSNICTHNREKARCKECSTVLNCPTCEYKTANKSHLKQHITTCKGDEIGSSGEVAIKNVLNEMKIDYEYDTSYEVMGCKSLLRWDFRIKADEPLFIEYDGKQHFEPATFGGMTKEKAELAFIKTKHYDKKKDDYCNDKQYLLLRIKYTEFSSIKLLVSNFIIENTNWGFE
tara:strand:+ start:78 stop:881 length:804 start_codon:yes stop_codon:yes gene_type:complete